MNWHRTISNLPADNEEVLIKWSGIISLATFNAGSSEFTTKSGTTISLSTPGLQWLVLGAPANSNVAADK